MRRLLDWIAVRLGYVPAHSANGSLYVQCNDGLWFGFTTASLGGHACDIERFRVVTYVGADGQDTSNLNVDFRLKKL